VGAGVEKDWEVFANRGKSRAHHVLDSGANNHKITIA
jgi:hypothetical protein